MFTLQTIFRSSSKDKSLILVLDSSRTKRNSKNSFRKLT